MTARWRACQRVVTPPSPRLGRVTHLMVRRRGSALRVRWRPVPGASAYEVVVTTTGAGQRMLRVRHGTANIRGVPKSVSGRVAVRAMAFLRQGPPARASFRATARRVNRLRVLPRPPRLR